MSQDAIPFTRIVGGLPSAVPFVGPETIERQRGAPFALRLGANESAFGVSPKAAEAMRAEVGRLSWYGDPEAYELREALAERHGVALEEICVGAGIDDLQSVVVRMTVEPGQTVVTSEGAYATFNYQVAGHGGRLHAVPYRDDREDPVRLLEAAHALRPPLVFLANPDNPMGTWQEAAAVSGLIEGLPERCLLVLDEAYIEFAPAGTAPPIDTSDPRVLRMRTFSKVHGMAGARIGYAIGHRELITGLNKIRSHFAANRVAQAGALASLGDPGFVAEVVAQVEAGRATLGALAERLGFSALPSATNFVAIDVGSGARARAMLAALAEEGVFIRMPGVAPLDRCIRVTVGTAEELAAIAPIFERVAGRLDNV